jgi:hypothetical protein
MSTDIYPVSYGNHWLYKWPPSAIMYPIYNGKQCFVKWPPSAIMYNVPNGKQCLRMGRMFVHGRLSTGIDYVYIVNYNLEADACPLSEHRLVSGRLSTLMNNVKKPEQSFLITCAALSKILIIFSRKTFSKY